MTRVNTCDFTVNSRAVMLTSALYSERIVKGFNSVLQLYDRRKINGLGYRDKEAQQKLPLGKFPSTTDKTTKMAKVGQLRSMLSHTV